MEYFTVKTIHPATAKHALLGHPWITKDAISSTWPKDKLLLNVQIKPTLTYTYLHDPTHPFCVARLFSKEKIQSIELLKVKIKANLITAIKKRLDQNIMATRNHFIMAFGESDDLPGLFITYLNQHILIQTQMPIWDTWILELKDWVSQACENSDLKIKNYWWQPRNSKQLKAKCFINSSFVEHTETFLVQEGDFQMHVTLGQSYDHGVYTDMSGIRSSLVQHKNIWQNKSVLNLFSYTGAFSLMSLKMGAKFCCSIDSSMTYQNILKNNLVLNSIDEKLHRTMTSDIQDGIKNLVEKKNAFDVVVLDPPSSFTSKQKKITALNLYPELLKKIEQITSPDGSIICFLNHHQTTRSKFEVMLKNALPKWHISQKLSLMQDASTLPYFPEGDYLKGAVLERKK